MKTQPSFTFRKTVETFVAGARTLPRDYFVSTGVFAEEQATIFSNQWLLVGHKNQIPQPGDYFLTTVGQENLIVVRSSVRQGEKAEPEICAFYNVCRHRGTRLKEEVCGHLSAIQCPYHAWTYALDGRLIGAPHMDEASGFNKAVYSLYEVNLGLFEGFIFVNLQRQTKPLQKWFASLLGKFSRWNLPTLRPAKRIEYEVQANWKLIFQNYSECYHCPGVHPMLSKVSPYDSAENDLTEGPFLGGFMKINQGRSLTMSGNVCASSVADPGATREEEGGEERVFYYSIFPNMLLSMHPDYVMVHQIWPQSPGLTLIYCDWFFHPEAFERNDFDPEDAIEFWDITNKQDWHVCELSQQGIASRAYKPGPYSPRESIPAAWDREYLRHVPHA